MKTINWKRAIIAGFLGTILFDLVGLLITGNWWDIPTILGAKTGLGLAYGVLGHYGNGVLLAILFAGIAPSLWGPKWLRPIIFVTAEMVALVWLFMLPLLGAGVAVDFFLKAVKGKSRVNFSECSLKSVGRPKIGEVVIIKIKSGVAFSQLVGAACIL